MKLNNKTMSSIKEVKTSNAKTEKVFNIITCIVGCSAYGAIIGAAFNVTHEMTSRQRTFKFARGGAILCGVFGAYASGHY